MNETYSLYVPCLSIAQPRPRATTIGGFTRMYEAKAGHPIHGFKQAVLAEWRAAGFPKITGPLSLSIEFIFPRKKFPKKFGEGRQWRTSKPDLDNLLKGFCDALNGLAYDDDSQIVKCLISKEFAAVREEPGVWATFEVLQ